MSALKRAALSTIATLIATGMIAFAPPATADDAMSAARSATSVVIVVSERYEATSRWTGTVNQQDLPYIRQPYADLAERFLVLAGVAVSTDAGAPIVLRIEAAGRTEATLFDSSINGHRIREPNYRAAEIVGTIRLETAAGQIERPFNGFIPAPYEFMVTFGYDPYRDPNNAPFREALEAPGGYAETIAVLIGEIYGEQVLREAASDRDPLVRRAAELALEAP
jgi:hypothetical protein